MTKEMQWYRRHHGANWRSVYEADKRKKEIAKPYQEAMAYYKEGGGFGAGIEAGLERGRTRSMASGMNALIGSGLAGTTMAAGLGKKYEEEVAAPTMAGVESTRAQNLSALNVAMGQAQQGGAQFSQSQSLQKYMANLQAEGQAGQLGLGYANLQAGQQQAADRLSLGYAELNARIQAQKQAQKQPATPSNYNFRVPAVAPSLFKPVSTAPTPSASNVREYEQALLKAKFGDRVTF